MSNKIVRLDLQKDVVKKVYDFGFLQQNSNLMTGAMFGRYLREGECLNGIAFDRKNKRIFLTGKFWPVMYDITWEDPMFK